MPAPLSTNEEAIAMDVTTNANTCDVCPISTASVTISVKEVLDRFNREAIPGVCDTGRYRCSYFSWGSGPPIIFLPGLTDDARSYIFLMAHLAAHFRCIAYDLPTGRSDGARLRHYTHENLVADCFALLDHLKIPQCYIFGSSFGSTIALAALRAYPDRLLRGILQGGFARRPLAIPEFLLARVARFWPGSMGHLPLRSALLRRYHAAPFAGRTTDFWDYFVQRSNAMPIAATARRAMLLHQVDLRSVLGEIRQPILLIRGDEDPLVGVDCAKMLLEGLPNADEVELVHCGHNPLFSHPELLSELVRHFLTPKPSGSTLQTVGEST